MVCYTARQSGAGVLHSVMVSTTSSVRSVRLPNDIWAQLVAEAEKRETTVNQLLHSFAIVGLLKSAEGRAAVMELRRVKAPAAKPTAVSVPLAGTFERKPMQKTPKVKK